MPNQRIPGDDDGLPPDPLDLARFDRDFADAPLEERTFDTIPDGKYEVNVDRVELTTAKSSGQPMLRWSLRILGPRCENRLLWRNNMLATRENIRWLKNDLHACGLDLQRLSDLPANLERLLDVKLEVTKRSKGDSENIYFNRRVVLASSASAAGAGGGNAQDSAKDDIPF
jgi:hypothetical protein